MMDEKRVKKVLDENSIEGSCEDCVFFDYDEYIDDYVCTLNLDEDEAVALMTRKNTHCPYYKYYDEYKFGRKQN